MCGTKWSHHDRGAGCNKIYGASCNRFLAFYNLKFVFFFRMWWTHIYASNHALYLLDIISKQLIFLSIFLSRNL